MNHFGTKRLSAERLNDDHLADLVALHLDPDVSHYLGGVRSAEVTKTYLATNMAHWDQHGFGLWALRTKHGAFAGRAGIRHILVDHVDEIEIAYTFKREFWGPGICQRDCGCADRDRTVRAETTVPDRPRLRRTWRLAARA